jgi:protein gp37
MAENTKIEWCDHTFNPWTGCTKVSPGCDHCYAEGWAKRSGAVKWGAGEPRRRTTEGNWKLPHKWNRQAKADGRRYRVFCASLADVFDNAVDPQWRADLFWLIEQTPHLDWLLLTKRIGNAHGMMRDAYAAIDPTADFPLPRPNVWIGATIVNQEEADRDIDKLDATPAAVRFLSMEPLLGPVDIGFTRLWGGMGRNGIDWVIVGGESGYGARPMNRAWAQSLRDQCARAGVPFLFKQWGEWMPCAQPPYDAMEKVGKFVSGRVLDGVTHDGYPA